MAQGTAESKVAVWPPRRSHHVVAPLSISWDESIEGCERTVEVDGRPELITIPPMVQSGQELCFPGRGRATEDGSPGNLVVVITVVGVGKGPASLAARVGGRPEMPIWLMGGACAGALLVGAAWYGFSQLRGAGPTETPGAQVTVATPTTAPSPAASQSSVSPIAVSTLPSNPKPDAPVANSRDSSPPKPEPNAGPRLAASVSPSRLLPKEATPAVRPVAAPKLTRVTICPESGLLAGRGCRRATGRFTPGEAPTRTCRRHAPAPREASRVASREGSRTGSRAAARIPRTAPPVAAVRKPAPAPVSASRFCGQCGGRVGRGSRFCGHCGSGV